MVDKMVTIKTSVNKRTVVLHLLVYAALIFVGFQAFLIIAGSKGAATNGGFSFNSLNPLHWGVNAPSSNEGMYSHLPLTNDGFNQLVEWDRTIPETPALQQQIAGFDVLIPCCGFQLSSADPNADCQCGHHLATRGLIKYGLTNGWTRDQIQQEINQWKPVFYPVCAQNPKICDL